MSLAPGPILNTEQCRGRRVGFIKWNKNYYNITDDKIDTMFFSFVFLSSTAIFKIEINNLIYFLRSSNWGVHLLFFVWKIVYIN